MAQLIDIRKVTIDPENLTARVRIADGAPLTTDEDIIGTTFVYNVIPQIADHVCLGDGGRTFKDSMGQTEIAHLLEHVTVELLAEAGEKGEISSGRTTPVEGREREFDVMISCLDDVLTVGALSSAAWILQWAYSGGGKPEPDVKAIVSGIVDLARESGVDEPSPVEQPAEQPVEQPADVQPAEQPTERPADVQPQDEASAPQAEADAEPEGNSVAAPEPEPTEAAAEPAPGPESEPAQEPESVPEPAQDGESFEGEQPAFDLEPEQPEEANQPDSDATEGDAAPDSSDTAGQIESIPDMPPRVPID